jgi:hypothetical protein
MASPLVYHLSTLTECKTPNAWLQHESKHSTFALETKHQKHAIEASAASISAASISAKVQA